MAVGNSYVVGRPIGSYSVLKPAGYSPGRLRVVGRKRWFARTHSGWKNLRI